MNKFIFGVTFGTLGLAMLNCINEILYVGKDVICSHLAEYILDQSEETPVTHAIGFKYQLGRGWRDS